MASTLNQAPRLVLASASAARAQILRNAGVEFSIEPAGVDEAAIKQRHREAGKDAVICAQALAEAKACAVSARHRESVVIGADQILVMRDSWLDKPADLGAAAINCAACAVADMRSSRRLARYVAIACCGERPRRQN